MLKLRSTLVPVEFASHWVQWILLAGILMVNSFPGLLLVGIGLFAIMTLIQFRYLTGRDRCQSPRISLAAQFRNHGLSNPGICFRCFEMGTILM